jgi:large subunit ribosomal protein L54
MFALTCRNKFPLLRASGVIFGPKKKPGKGSESSSQSQEKIAPGMDHIFNIFADTEDVKVKSDEFYPEWLWRLDKPQKTYGEMESMFVHGKDIEEATLFDYRRFRRHHRKIIIKLNNNKLARRPSPRESKLVN